MTTMIPKSLDTFIVISHFFTGFLYLVYFFLVFIQKRISLSLRLGCSALFLTLGLLFMNEGGKLLTEGVYDQLNFLTLVMTLAVALSGMAVSYILIKK